MFNEKKFRSLLKEKGITIQKVDDILNIDISTLYRKMNGTSDFYRNEMDSLIRELEIENPSEIFFADEFA